MTGEAMNPSIVSKEAMYFVGVLAGIAPIWMAKV